MTREQIAYLRALVLEEKERVDMTLRLTLFGEYGEKVRRKADLINETLTRLDELAEKTA